MSEASRQAARRLGLEESGGELKLTSKSLLASVGGWWGVVETVTPTLLFAISFALFQQVLVSVWLAAGSAALFIFWRLLRRQSLIQPIAGLLGVALSVFLALREGGSGADYFLVGFVTNSIFAAGLIFSVLIRYPLLGVIGGLLFNLQDWRSDKVLRARFNLLTWVWIGFFSLRLVVQLPLYFAEELALLATARLVMGLPAYAALLVLTWLLMRGIANSRARNLN